jgi:type II secretory pathway pseudopilin PulG
MEPEEFRIPQAPKPSQSDKIATHQHHRKQHPMKLTHTLSAKPKSGMTLLELTVVILVLLSLISILFIGARAWKKSADRSANILNVRNCQQAMRGHQNTRNYLATEAVTTDVIFGTTAAPGYLKKPTPPIPLAGGYTFGGTYGAPGTLWITNADIGGVATAGEYFFSTAELADKTGEW